MSPNDQVERRADATPAQNENMNRHVRSNAGLGGRTTEPAIHTHCIRKAILTGRHSSQRRRWWLWRRGVVKLDD